MSDTREIYGLVAEFGESDRLVEAARRVRDAGYVKIDAYSPFPIPELEKALGLSGTKLPWLVLAGGVLGAVLGYSIQYYTAVMAYPINVGGRPLHSWPAFVPVTFELSILVAALGAVLGMLALNGLPMPYHPLFNVPQFSLVSQYCFFLAVEASDPQFDRETTRRFLESLGPNEVIDVPC